MEELDEVYKKYHGLVNMSASELESWSKTECSKTASEDRTPIERNLRLLRKKKADWNEQDIKDANKTISFISRMSKAENSDTQGDCPSKRDVSLMNWAYDPNKASKSLAVKTLTDTKIAGYGVLFDIMDLTGDIFTRETDFNLERSLVGMPVYYAHNQESLKGKIGTVTDYSIDDTGVWFEMELDKSNKYLEAIRKLASEKRVGLSTGALSHTLEKDGSYIKVWTVGEISLTVTPAEHKTITYTQIVKERKPLEDAQNTQLEEYIKKVDTLLGMWENTKDVKTGKVGGGSKENEAGSFGGFLKAVKTGDIERIEKIYNAHEANAVKLLNTGTGSDGGYLVPQQFSNVILANLNRMEIVRPRAILQPLPFGNVEIPAIDYGQTWTEGADPMLGGLQMYWTAEGAQDTQSEPEFRQVTLSSKEATTSVPVSNKLLDNNAIGLEAVLMRVFSQAVAYTEDYAYLRGDGVGKPLGVLNAAATLTSTVTTGSVTVAELAGMYVKLDPECVDTAVWVIHPLLFDQIMELNADNDSALTYLPDINGRITTMLFGIPILRSKIMPNTFAGGGLAVVDFQRYIIGDDLAMEVAVSEHAQFRQRRTLWRCTIRTDGQPEMNVAAPVGPGGNDLVSFAVKSSS